MSSTPVSKKSTHPRENRGAVIGGDRSGVALFIVLSAVAILSFLVTEVAYVSHVAQKMAYDELDRVKAFYLAKSAYKISLLRLKAYQNVKELTSGEGGLGGLVPKSLLE